MTVVRRKTLTLALFFATALLAGTADAAKSVAPKLSGLHARVAQGGHVDLAASTLTASALAVLRPHFQNLKPRVRSNAE